MEETRRSKRFCVSLQRGGVGKTTVVTQFADEFARQGKKVLIVDMDPQGNATAWAAMSDDIYQFQDYTVAEVLKGEEPILKCIKHHPDRPGIDFLPAEDALAWFPKWLYTEHKGNKLTLLDARLEEVDHLYDYIMIDTGPALGDLMLNAMCASDYVIVPTTCGEWSYQAVQHFLAAVNEAKQAMKLVYKKDRAHLVGILRNAYQDRQSVESAYSSLFEEDFPDDLLNTIVPSKSKIKELATGTANLNRQDNREAVGKFQEAVEEVMRRVEG